MGLIHSREMGKVEHPFIGQLTMDASRRPTSYLVSRKLTLTVRMLKD